MTAQLNYIAPFNRTGYGIAAIGYAEGLYSILGKDGFNYACIGEPDVGNPELKEKTHLLEMIKAVDPELPNLIFWHLHDMAQFIGPNVNVGLTTFEADDFKPEEKVLVPRLDALGTASSWGQQVIQHRFPNYDKEVFVAPHAFKVLDTDELPSLNPINPLDKWSELLGDQLPEDVFILSSAGKQETRKGHMALLDVLPELDFPTLLVSFWYNPFVPDGFEFHEFYYRTYEPLVTPSQLKLFRKNNSWVVVMPPTPTRYELHGALATSHTFISPSFAEGWDLPLFEMMSFGHHCCSGGVTGQSEYVTKENVVPISWDVDDREIANDGRFFHGHGGWYRLRDSNIAEAITECHRQHFDSNEAESLQKIRKAARADASNFTWQKSAQEVLRVLQNHITPVSV